MSAQAKTADADAAAGEIDGKASKKKMSGKKLTLFVGLPVLLLLGGGGAYVAGLFGGEAAPTEEHAAAEGDHASGKANDHAPSSGGAAQGEPKKSASGFYDLPELLVNLNSNGRRTNFLKLQVSLELANEGDKAKLEAMKPRIVDSFQVYLRELRIEDLRGSSGMYRLREELLARVNSAVAPAKIKDVLFKEVLIQ